MCRSKAAQVDPSTVTTLLQVLVWTRLSLKQRVNAKSSPAHPHDALRLALVAPGREADLSWEAAEKEEQEEEEAAAEELGAWDGP